MSKYRLKWEKWPETPPPSWIGDRYYWFLYDWRGRCISVNNTIEQAMQFVPGVHRRVAS